VCFAWSRAIPELLWIYLSRRRCDVLFAMVKNREPYQAPPQPSTITHAPRHLTRNIGTRCEWWPS